MRLVVKSTGHDYLGRSIAPGALSIWTHHLNSQTYHQDGFELDGSGRIIEGSAITAGGGTPMLEVYEFADARGRTVVGGTGATVGVAGYSSGGGHSVLSPRRGLAADNVLQAEVVTPAGELLTVNEDRHPDLFWALRGVSDIFPPPLFSLFFTLDKEQRRKARARGNLTVNRAAAQPLAS